MRRFHLAWSERSWASNLITCARAYTNGARRNRAARVKNVSDEAPGHTQQFDFCRESCSMDSRSPHTGGLKRNRDPGGSLRDIRISYAADSRVSRQRRRKRRRAWRTAFRM
jgi:hypothetical protein